MYINLYVYIYIYICIVEGSPTQSRISPSRRSRGPCARAYQNLYNHKFQSIHLQLRGDCSHQVKCQNSLLPSAKYRIPNSWKIVGYRILGKRILTLQNTHLDPEGKTSRNPSDKSKLARWGD